MSDLPLFSYPMNAGFKSSSTSLNAAQNIEKGGRAKTLRHKVLELIKKTDVFYNGFTADECAAMLGETVLAIRPRVAELNKRNLIHDSGKRRTNISGSKAIVWLAT